MAQFQGRAKETVKMPSKPIPQDFKIWCLANLGYLLNWCFHAREEGPVNLSNYWHTGHGFSKTQAVVLDLVCQLPNQGSNHVVWMDNLFTSVRLLTTLRERGVGGAGTVRTGKSKAQLEAEDALAQDPEQSQQQSQQQSQLLRRQL